jgi:predicted  nucleic acid-binding Zn-ribbon protein
MGAISKRELLSEEHIAPVTVLESDGSGVLRFEAIVSEADFRNRNNRIYPREVLFPAFERHNEQIARGLAQPGLVDHPGFLSGASVSDIGVAWENFWFEGALVKGRGRIVPTAKGRDLEAAMQAGIAVGFSTRGYGEAEEEERDGETVRVMRAYDLETVDAVVDPSVLHARVTRYTKEELDAMEKELEEARAALEAAQGRTTELECQVEATNSRVSELEGELAAANERAEAAAAEGNTLRERVTALESELAKLAAEKAETDLENKLNELTSEHRFGATIRAKVKEMRAKGLAVNLDTIEGIVALLRDLVEAAGAAANDQATPAGDLSTDEDAAPAEDTQNGLTEEQLADLRASGLA